MRIVVGLALLVTGVFIGALIAGPTRTVTGTPAAVARTDSHQAAAPEFGVGDCVVIDPAQNPGTAAKVDCADPRAAYEVGTQHAGTTRTCPSDSYDPYVDPEGQFSLCLMINGHEGDCFTGIGGFSLGTDDGEPAVKTDCIGGGEVVVRQRLERVDPAACGPESRFQLVYPEPGRTLCFT